MSADTTSLRWMPFGRCMSLCACKTHRLMCRAVTSCSGQVSAIPPSWNGIEKRFGCKPEIILRSSTELEESISKNPFAKRRDIDPGKLLVLFLAGEPSVQGREKVLAIKADPEELRMRGREAYIYFPNGMGKTKLPWSLIEKALGIPGTGRNWNSVTKLMEMARKLEAVN